MGEVDLLEYLDLVPLCRAEGGGRPLADAVYSDERGLFKGAREEGRRRMGQVMGESSTSPS